MLIRHYEFNFMMLVVLVYAVADVIKVLLNNDRNSEVFDSCFLDNYSTFYIINESF